MAKSNSLQQQNTVDVVSSSDLVALYFSLDEDLPASATGPGSDCYSKQVLLSMMEVGPCGPISDIETHSIPHVLDPIQHISKCATLVRPGANDCEHLVRQTDFEQPATSWISMTTKLDEYVIALQNLSSL